MIQQAQVDCPMNASLIAADGNVTFKEAKLDLCTIEGIPEGDGGKPVTGVMPNANALPDNTCRPAADQPGGYVSGVHSLCLQASALH